MVSWTVVVSMLYTHAHACLIIDTEDGMVELNWYEIGRVLATDNETDYVYVGDKDIWPGIYYTLPA